jgi:4-amino-4-deoxy-L-arabinose transferase-like glycosyltransferase
MSNDTLEAVESKHFLPGKPWRFNFSKSLLGLLAISIILLVGWSLAVPIFEAPDEPHHWLFARYINDKKWLPVFNKELVEANSPPLYYALIAPVASESQFPPIFVGKNGKPTPLGLNMVLGDGKPALKIYQNDINDFGKYWPMRAARLLTVVMSVITILFTYLAGREATRRVSTGLLAGGIVAFLPQFSFRGSQISNDALVATFGAASLYFIVRLIRRGFSWPSGLLAGVAITAAYLSKISAIFLPVPLALALLTEKISWPRRLGRLAALGGLMLALVFPWTLRNIVLYGDPFANNTMYSVVSNIVVKKPLTSPYFYTIFPAQLSQSFVGVFGWMNLWMPLWVYLLYGAIGLLTTGGLVGGWLQHKLDRRLILILLTMPILNLLVVININLSFDQPQGRYMFPAIGAIGLLAALGLESLPFWRRSSHWLLLGGMLAFNIFILTAWLIPAYWG